MLYRSYRYIILIVDSVFGFFPRKIRTSRELAGSKSLCLSVFYVNNERKEGWKILLCMCMLLIKLLLDCMKKWAMKPILPIIIKRRFLKAII